MATSSPPLAPWRERFSAWFFETQQETLVESGDHTAHKPKPWWQVMCLTGVDYFSTLGYQPGIAFLAAGALSPIATLILVLVTIFAAYPVYSRVASRSPHGAGSVAMLENLLPRWSGKLFVLILLGFAATDFVITITLSAADATEHIIENPFVPDWLDHRVGLTLFLVLLLGGVFMKGFKEAIGLAVALVALYLTLNMCVIVVGLHELWTHPTLLKSWQTDLFTAHGNPVMMLLLAILVFPKLALGLSGFETGVAVMPLVKGDPGDNPHLPEGRIRNTRWLLITAALIMSFYLIASSLVTTILIPPAAFNAGGPAYGRALAYLAHEKLGEIFGTLYDLSTISILWFAGASAMAGLLNIVPRYLPRYGMAPDWARGTRPLVIVFTTVACVVTIMFEADVNAQGAAYATGVLVLMTSAALAVLLSVWPKIWLRWYFLAILVVFLYTTICNMFERPEGLHIASFFIGTVIVVSITSRLFRATELRCERVVLDEAAEKFLIEAKGQTLRIIANYRDHGTLAEYRSKEHEQREINHLPEGDLIFFLEIVVPDASSFSDTLHVRGEKVGKYRIFSATSTTVPNAIAAFLLYLRDRTGEKPHIYFHWKEGNPILEVITYLFLGEGDIPPITREVLRRAEPNLARRPAVHVGG